MGLLIRFWSRSLEFRKGDIFHRRKNTGHMISSVDNGGIRQDAYELRCRSNPKTAITPVTQNDAEKAERQLSAET